MTIHFPEDMRLFYRGMDGSKNEMSHRGCTDLIFATGRLLRTAFLNWSVSPIGYSSATSLHFSDRTPEYKKVLSRAFGSGLRNFSWNVSDSCLLSPRGGGMLIWNQVQSVQHGIFVIDFQLSGQSLLPISSARYFGFSPYPRAFAELRILEFIAHRRLKFVRNLCGQMVKIDQVELVHSYIQTPLIKHHFSCQQRF